MSAATLVLPSAAELEEDYRDGSEFQPITAVFYIFEPTTTDIED